MESTSLGHQECTRRGFGKFGASALLGAIMIQQQRGCNGLFKAEVKETKQEAEMRLKRRYRELEILRAQYLTNIENGGVMEDSASEDFNEKAARYNAEIHSLGLDLKEVEYFPRPDRD